MADLQDLLQRSFTGGELAPSLYARADTAKYTAGVKTCRNLIVQRHGGAAKRPGTRFIKAAKSSTNKPRYIPFIFKAADQSYLLELGNQYIRFFWHDGIVLSASVPYEIATPYAIADVGAIKYSQSADVLTLTHPSYPPQEVRRIAATNWTCSDASFAPGISPPAALSGGVGISNPSSLLQYSYVVTAAKVDTYEESLPTAPCTLIQLDPPTAANPNILNMTGLPSDAAEYYVYLDVSQNGIYGFIGSTPNNKFYDAGFTPDYTITPPTPKDVFAATNDYPSVGAYYQQRQWFANSNNKRETVWGSRVGAYHNFNISTPLQDDDSIEFILAGLHLNPVNFLIPMKRLVVFTDEGGHVVKGDDTGAIVPSKINPEQDEYVGSSATVRPVPVGESILFCDRSERTIRDLSFNQQYDGFSGQDLTIFAAHLFDGYTVVDMAYQQIPHSIIWCVRSDGVLLGLTYVKAQEVWAWHRHDIDGTVESVNVLPDAAGGDDIVYLGVRRHINGSYVRYLERLAPRYIPTVTAATAAFFVDAGLTYSGSATTSLSGLDHLEGARVAILGDGLVVSDGRGAGTTYTIVAGVVTPALPAAVTTAVVGLPMPYSDLETLPPDVQGSGVRAKRKRPEALKLIVDQTAPGGFLAGLDENSLIRDTAQPWESTTEPRTGATEITLTTNFNEDGSVLIRHDQPLPFTVLAVFPAVEIGG